MVTRRPSIFIYTYHADEKLLAEVCAGMEEEGVFFEIFRMEEEKNNPVSGKSPEICAETLARRAAEDSMMGSGIGMDGSEIVLQMKGLPGDRYVELHKNPTKQNCRITGANAARIMKKMPLRDNIKSCGKESSS